MALFFVSYDLRNARNYQALHDELKKLGAVRMLESCWCLKRFNTTEKELRDYLTRFIDEDDGLLVSQIGEKNGTPQWAGWNLEGTPNEL